MVRVGNAKPHVGVCGQHSSCTVCTASIMVDENQLWSCIASSQQRLYVAQRDNPDFTSDGLPTYAMQMEL